MRVTTAAEVREWRMPSGPGVRRCREDSQGARDVGIRSEIACTRLGSTGTEVPVQDGEVKKGCKSGVVELIRG